MQDLGQANQAAVRYHLHTMYPSLLPVDQIGHIVGVGARGYLVSRLNLTKKDVVLIDRTTGIGQAILQNAGSARGRYASHRPVAMP